MTTAPGATVSRPAAPAAASPRHTRAFVTAAASLVAVFAASSAPIPVFNIYRAEDGLTTADLSVSVVAYFGGTVVALLCLGRIANVVGSRPAALATLLVMLAACLVLLDVTGLAVLVAGRVLMGLGAGMASSALTTYIVDSAPHEPAWLATAVTSQAPMVGLTAGALASGTIVQYVPHARLVVYAVMAVLLLACVGLLLDSPETGRRTPGLVASLRPRVHVPPIARPLLPVAVSIYVATWALGAFYQSFGVLALFGTVITVAWARDPRRA
ncbi:MAG: MFS transporter [Tetrasphaera sp.]